MANFNSKGNPKWKKGVSGNPGGKPAGHKDRAVAIREALFAQFEKQGPEWLKNVADKEPIAFLKVVAQILPKLVDASVNVNMTYENLLNEVASLEIPTESDE